MFTLAFFFLVMSNLPWFRDLTFQLSMDHHSSQHWTFTTRHIHSWASFLLWPSYFILSVATSNCPPFFSSSILDNFWPGSSSSTFISFCFFFLCKGLLQQEYWSGLSLLPSVDHYDPSISGGPAQHGHCFIELHNPLCHNRLCSMKGTSRYLFLYLQTCHKIAIQ